MSIRPRHAAAVFFLLTVVAPAASQQRLGGEFRVNTYTTGYQFSPAIASDTEGNFVVVWDGGDIFGQRFDGFGNPFGGEFQVNTFTTGGERYPAVASDAEGNFVVVWDGAGSGDSYGVFGQRFDGSGNALGNEFRVNTYTTYKQRHPAVALDAEGDFVVVWSGASGRRDVFGQRFAASGQPVGGEFQVNTYTTGYQGSRRGPAVASDADGNFVVTWDGRGSGDSFGIFGQRYDAAGNARGGEFRVNTYRPYLQIAPAVGMHPAGDFVVVWDTYYPYFDGGYVTVLGQRYDSAGQPLGGEFQVNTNQAYISYFGQGPDAAVDRNGSFVVVWNGLNGITDPVGRVFDSAGSPIGGEFQVNTYTTGWQYAPAVASDAQGDFVVVWDGGRPPPGLRDPGVESRPQPYGDVIGQRFAGPGLALSADGSCPGIVEVTLSQAPPSSEVAVLAAANTNGFTKGGTLCAGTELELGEPFQLSPTWVIVDGEGNGSATLDLGRKGCNLEALALASCETSNVVQVP